MIRKKWLSKENKNDESTRNAHKIKNVQEILYGSKNNITDFFALFLLSDKRQNK